jgi:hypothetical protein
MTQCHCRSSCTRHLSHEGQVPPLRCQNTGEGDLRWYFDQPNGGKPRRAVGNPPTSTSGSAWPSASCLFTSKFPSPPLSPRFQKSVLGVVDVVHIGKVHRLPSHTPKTPLHFVLCHPVFIESFSHIPLRLSPAQIIKLLRGLGPSPLLSSDCRAVSPPPAKRQHHDAPHPAPPASFTVAPSAAAIVPAIALQADSAEIMKLQQHDEPKERHQQKKKQSKRGDGGSKPKSEAEARPKADAALLNAPPPPGYKGPPNSLTPSKRGDGGSKPKSEAEARPKADAALLNAPPPPGYKGPPSNLFKKTAPHDDPPSQLGKRQSKPNDSMTKVPSPDTYISDVLLLLQAGFDVTPIGYSPQSSPLPDFDDYGWSNVCRCLHSLLCACRQLEARAY